jgi:hypothetical protein
VLVAAVVAATVLAASLVCGGCGAGESTAGHWGGDAVSLDWPDGWRLEPERVMPSQLEYVLKTTVLCELRKDKPYGQAVLMVRDLAPGETLQSVFDETYAAVVAVNPLARELSDESTRVSGLPAVVKSYEAPVGEPFYEYRDVWVEKDGRLYVLAGWAYVGSASAQVWPGFDAIVQSFKVGVAQ